MRLLAISHTYIVDINREKIDELARVPNLEVGLIVPSKWTDILRISEYQRSNTLVYQSFPVPIFLNGDIARFFFNPFKLFKAFWDFRPEIVQVEEEPWSLALLQSLILSKIFRARAVFFTWQNILSNYSHLATIIEKINFRLSDGAIAGNSEAGKVLKQRGFLKPTEVIPQLGVNPQTFLPRQSTGESSDTIIGYIGRFVEEKGIVDLLNAFIKLTGSVRLKLVGRGFLEPGIKEFILQHELSGRVEIIKAVAHNEVPKFMQSLDIFVLPSKTTSFWKEQFGHVLIEAMACKVAVLGSSSGAIPEVIGDCGLIFQEGNIDDLREKLQRLIDDSVFRKEMAEKGYQRILDRFTNQRIAQQTSEYYRAILEGFTSDLVGGETLR